MSRFIFDKIRPQYLQEILNLVTDFYYTLNPVYRKLDMDIKNFQDFIKPSIADEKNQLLSFVLIDKKLNKIIGVKITRDFSLLQFNPDQYDHPKQQFKHNLDCGVLQEHLNQSFNYGEVCTEELMAIDVQLSQSDVNFVAHQMLLEHLRIMYLNGYTKDISPLYVREQVDIAQNTIGYIQNRWFLDNVKFNGNTLFRAEEAICYIIDITDNDMQRLFGQEFVEHKKKVQQSACLKQQKIQQLRLKLSYHEQQIMNKKPKL